MIFRFYKNYKNEIIWIDFDQFWSFVILYNQVIQFWYLSAFSSLLNLLINECFFTHFWFWITVVFTSICQQMLNLLYLIIASGLSTTPTFLSLTFFLPDYNLWLRLISQEFTFAIPLTYWVLDDEISNGQSLLPFVLVPKFYPDILFLLYFFLFRSQISIFSYYYKLSILKIVLYTLHLQNAHNQNV